MTATEQLMESPAAEIAATGVIHGRFQVFHHDHLAYLLAGKRLCRHLVVGITNPDPSHTRVDAADPHRSALLANPLTYYERYRLVRAALTEAGVADAHFSVVPFPINFPELYSHYLPLDALFLLTIYDAWGERKLAMFREMGLATHVLRRVAPREKGLSASDIRERMRRGEPWTGFLPPVVAGLLEQWGIPQRLRMLAGEGERL